MATDRSFAALLISGLVLSLFHVACGKSSKVKPVANESEFIGKWESVEASIAGKRGATTGILEARMEFFANHTTTGVLVYHKIAIANPKENPDAFGPHPWSSTWTFTNGILHQKHGTNEPAPSKVWFEEDLLTIQPSPVRVNSLTLILKRAE